MCLAVTCAFVAGGGGGGGGEGVRNTGVEQIPKEHRKLTLEKKILLPGPEPETFRSGIRSSTTELSPLPRSIASLKPVRHGTVFRFKWQL